MLSSQLEVLDQYENDLANREILDGDIKGQVVDVEEEEQYDSIFLKYPLNSANLVYLRFKQVHVNSPFSTIVESFYAG